ncbi:uncharacterized protein LOC143286863 [Babylonia areolata]|uniref:uncharacterized protein LOC143286863 n=1 Tax=Babylonia areolata TaxID=304850 RepID=UPI003FD4B4D3
MMELTVWVDGIPRVVCGATYNTTCQDVVVALAYAMDRTGRFTFLEKWRDSSRPLTPDDYPLQVLHKWGEYAAEVHFVLCQPSTEDGKQQVKDKWLRKRGEQHVFPHHFMHQKGIRTAGTATVKRSLTFSGAYNHHQQTSVVTPSAPTSKFRKTQKGPVPNGDVHNRSGTAHGSSPSLLPKQLRRMGGEQQAHTSGKSLPLPHPVPPPRHRPSTAQSQQVSVSHNIGNSVSQPSTSLPDTRFDDKKNTVPSRQQPLPAARSLSVTSVAPPVSPHPVSDTVLPSRLQARSQTQSPPQPEPPNQTVKQGHEPTPHTQTQHTTSRTPTPPLPLSPPPSSATLVSHPDEEQCQDTVTLVSCLDLEHGEDTVTLVSHPEKGHCLDTIALESHPDQEHGHAPEETPGLVETSLDSLEHSRRASLEIEEYDLEHNFPDTHREHGHSERPSVSLEYSLEEGMRSGSQGQLDSEHAKLLQLVDRLQEELKTQESQMGALNAEITDLEGKEKEYEEKLHVIMEELLLYENREHDLDGQLTDLEKVEWENVLDDEKKCEVDLTHKIASVKAAVAEQDEKLAEFKAKESKLLNEIKQEEEKINQEKERLKAEEAKAREEEEKTEEEISKLQTLITEEQKKTAEHEASLSNVDMELKSVGEKLTGKQTALTEAEAKLKEENLKDFAAHPVPRQDPKGAKPANSGETVLKILEGRLSPRPPTSAPVKTGDGPPLPPFVDALTTSNPSGVWV